MTVTVCLVAAGSTAEQTVAVNPLQCGALLVALEERGATEHYRLLRRNKHGVD
jgi:hypothetical protein